MSNNTDNKEPLKLKLNLDYRVIFENEPGSGKEYTSEKYGTKSYLYFLEVFDKRANAFTKERWYANEKQQKILETSALIAGEEYVIVKEEIEGSKAQNFWVYDTSMNKLNGRGKNMQTHVDRVTQAMTSDDLPPLEEYLKDPESGPIINSQSPTPINANKTQGTLLHHVDAVTVGWALKVAVQSMGPIVHEKKGYNGLMDEVMTRARELIKAHDNLRKEYV